MIFDLLGEGICGPCKPPHVHSHGQVLAFNEASGGNKKGNRRQQNLTLGIAEKELTRILKNHKAMLALYSTAQKAV